MNDLLKGWVPLLLLAVTACSEGAPGAVDAGPRSATSTPPPALAPAGIFGARTPSSGPEALWSEYQAIHAKAGPDNTLEIGRRLDALMTDEARALIASAMS